MSFCFPSISHLFFKENRENELFFKEKSHFKKSLEKNRIFYGMIEKAKNVFRMEISVWGGARLQDDRIKISAVRCVSWKIVSCCRLNETAIMSASF